MNSQAHTSDSVWASELSGGWPSTKCVLKTRNGKPLNPDRYFLIPRENCCFSTSNKCQVQSTHLSNSVWGTILFFMYSLFYFLYLLLKQNPQRTMSSLYDVSYSYNQHLQEVNEGTAQGKESSSALSLSLLDPVLQQSRAFLLRALEGVTSVSHE